MSSAKSVSKGEIRSVFRPLGDKNGVQEGEGDVDVTPGLV